MEGLFLNPKVWAICVLVFLSSLISGLETAFVSANRLRYKELSERGDKKAKAIWSLYENPNGVIGALLVGNNAVNIVASALATDVALELAGDWGVAIASGLMIFIILVAGEITPKSIAFQRANDMVESMWWLLKGFAMAFWPLVFVLGQIADILSRPFKASWRNVKVLPDVDVEDLKAMISAIRNVEVDKEMIRGVLALPDKEVH